MPILQKKFNFDSIYSIVFLYIGWVVSLLTISQIYFCFSGVKECLQINTLGNWDGEHFLQIINQGYIYDFSFAFFPLFPMLVKVTDIILPFSSLINGLILNFFLSGLGLVYLYRVFLMDFKKKQSFEILLFILAFPLSFFFFTFYSEALFFFLSVLAVYFYRKQHYWSSVFLLTLLTLTRMAGLALLAAILIDVWSNKSERNKFLMPFLGIGSYFFAVFLITGNLWTIAKAETNWERIITIPGFALYNSIWVLIREGISYQSYSIFLNLLLVVIVFYLLIRSFRFLPRLYWNYTFFSLLVPLSTSTFLSFPRFLMVIFPLFIAFYLCSNTIVRMGYLITGFVICNLLFTIFLLGGWVA